MRGGEIPTYGELLFFKKGEGANCIIMRHQDFEGCLPKTQQDNLSGLLLLFCGLAEDCFKTAQDVWSMPKNESDEWLELNFESDSR